jgi:hypothetical protein
MEPRCLDSVTMDATEFASEIWTAELRETPKTGWEHRKRMLITLAMGIFSAIAGSSTAPSLSDLVIVRRTDGEVVHSTSAGDVDDAPGILQTARDELDILTPEQFASEWGFTRT